MNSLESLDTLALDISESVATLTLNRPHAMNAIDRRMAEELTDVLQALDARADVRALVLQGAGGHFCAGGDVKGMRELGPRTVDEAHHGMTRYRRLTEALIGFRHPVVAAADGVAFGAGFSLLLLADLVLLGEGARLSMAFGRVGLIPDCGALFTLPRVVGLQRAKELVFSAREIDAQEALQLGLALEVHSGEALHARARALALGFTTGSGLALSLAKQGLNRSMHSDLGELLDFEAAGQALALASEHHSAAVRQFLARKA